MEIYLLKSAACLAILMLFYKLLLEKENMHVFKRVYLLSAVLVSFIIPWITFTSYVELPAAPQISFFEVAKEAGESESSESLFSSLLPAGLWTIYGLGVIFFGFKFSRNLQEILLKIRRNPRIKRNNTTNVLLQEEVTPHTFWSYVFLNKKKYYEDKIPLEVFEHEQAHAVQRHSLDVLLIELLQVIFWFHPLLYLVKSAIKLNHEFLADMAVIKKGINRTTYQETLLAFSSGAANSSFVHSINYQSIKKRFTVMKTNTSKSRIWITSLLLFPLIGGLLYGFSSTETVVKDPTTSTFSTSAGTSSETLEISINEKGIIQVAGKQVTLQEIREDLKPNKYTNYAINAAPSAPKEVMEELMQAVLALRVEGTVTVCSSGEDNGKNVMNEIFNNVQDQEKPTPQMVAEYNKWAKHYKENDDAPVEKRTFERMKYIFSIMTPAQRKDSESFPSINPNKVITIVEDKNGGKTEYEKERYGEVPPPPPPPVPTVSKDGDVPPPPPPPPAPKVEKAGDIPAPPPPPPSPIEAVEGWIEEGAAFYLNGKKITGKEALEVVKENNGKNLSVKVEENASGKTVRLSDNKR